MSNYNSQLQSNNTDLQGVLELLQTKAAGENLDEEISSQEALISEQDAKIAELAEILAGKASGGSGVTIEAWTGMIDVPLPLGMELEYSFYYIDENLNIQNFSYTANDAGYTFTIAAGTFLGYSVEDDSPVSGRGGVFVPTSNNFVITTL